MTTRVRSEVLTFLIADVRGYTRFTRTHGDEAAAELALAFAEIIREGVESHDGEVLQLKGDEAVAVFRSARAALRAAVELQLVFEDERRLRPRLALDVGVGIDTGEAVPVDGDYHGGALNLASRLCSSAGAGEVFASAGVAHAARGLADLRFDECEPLVLKGFDVPVAALRVFPAATPTAWSSTLQTPSLPEELDLVTPLVGREEIVRRLRWRWRLTRRGHTSAVAIVGASGIGKTRLAAEIAATAAADGAHVAYVSPDIDAGAVGNAAFVVFDDLHDVSAEQLHVAISAVNASSRCTLLLYDDDQAPAEVVSAVRGIAAPDDVIRLGPLDDAAARRIASLYVETGDAIPQNVLADGHGVPRLIHQEIARWVQAEAVRRLARVAADTRTGREELRTLESTLANEVIELQAARETVVLYGERRTELEQPPYKGLESFGVDDADYFFGREQLVADMVARLAGAPLLAIVGASGSGKSSALSAGLLPALASGALPTRKRWHIALMRPGEHPLRELDRGLWSSLPRDVTARMSGADDPLRAARGALDPESGLVVAVDQFEELFTLCCDEAERRAFLSVLLDATGATEQNEVVIVAIRADDYARFAVDPVLAELVAANHVLVGPMTETEYRRAITKPALARGVRVEAQLVDALADDVVGEPGALPLLSSALLELWTRRGGRSILLSSYVATGGVRGAVARLAETAYAALSEEEQRVARNLFLRLAGDGVRRRVPTEELDAESNPVVARVLESLAAARLVTVGEGVVEIAHEALLREWPRYAGWLADDRDGRELHARLGAAAREWDARGRDPGDLFRGVRLSSTLDWAAAHEHELNELERRFADESRAESERELHEQMRHNRRLRALLVGALVLLVAAIAAGAVALVARTHARTSATAAVAARLGSQALTARDLDTSLLLAVQGVALDDTPETRGNLEAALMRSPAALRVYRPLAGALTSVDVSPDGKLLLFGNAAGSFALVDARSGEIRKTVRADAARFAVDGGVIVVRGLRIGELSAGAERSIGRLPVGTTIAAIARNARLVAVTRGRPNGHPTSVELVALPSGRVTHVVIPPAGATLGDVTLSDDGSTLLVAETVGGTEPTVLASWRLAPWHAGRTIRDARGFSTHASLSLDGSRVVAGHADGSVSVYSLASGAARDLHGRHDAGVTGVGFSRDGRTVISTGGDERALVWDAGTGDFREMLTGHVGRVLGPAFGPHDKTAYTVGLDGTAIAWDLFGSRRLSSSFQAGHAPVIEGRPTVSFALSPDGRQIVVPVAGGAGEADVLSLPSGKKVAVLSDTPAFIPSSLAWVPHSRTLVGTGPLGRSVLWQVVTGSTDDEPARFFELPPGSGPPVAVAVTDGADMVAVGTRRGLVFRFAVGGGRALGRALDAGAWVQQLAFDPTRGLLAAAAGPAGVHVWRVSDGRPLYPLPHPTQAVAFSPDGKLLALGGSDGDVRFVHAADGTVTGPPLHGNAAILSIAFSPDGRAFATGASDGTVRIYDLASRQPIGAPLPGVADLPAGVVFSPDGRRLISFSATGRTFLFDLVASDWTRAACRIAGRTLSRAEWARFLPGRRYRPVCR